MSFSPAIAKEAFKTALALTLAYAISLRMGWDNPYWAGFAVAMISLSTVGQSLNKGALRMLGTLAAAAAITLVALFAQDRWWFIAVLSLYLAFCVYKVTGNSYQYFWWCCAFVTLVICTGAAGDPSDAFEVAVLRVQQTGMGILVYTLVSVFLWPSSTRDGLHVATRKLLATQASLYRAYRELARGHGTAQELQPQRLQEVQLLGQFEQARRAAETDSYEVSEARHIWRRLHRECAFLLETLEHWRESFPEVERLDAGTLATNLDAVCNEVDARFAQIERMLAGEAPTRPPEPVRLVVDEAGVRALGHFEKAAVVVYRANLDRLEALTRSVFDCVRDVAGHGDSNPRPVAAGAGELAAPRAAPTGIDPDRLLGAGKTVVMVWVAFIAWFYVDPPGHAGFVEIAGIFFMASLMMRLDPLTILKPILVGTLLAGLLYIFVMPRLSGYTELGTMIFVTMFAIGYLLGTPRQALAKTALTAMFLSVIGVQNEQTYDFAAFANTVLSVTLGAGALVVAVTYLPPSPRPEKVFLRLLARFFRHSDHLLSRLAPDATRGKGIVGRWRGAFYQADLLDLPQKLAALGARIDHRAFPDNSPEQVQALVNSLQVFALRVKEVVEARNLPHADLLVHGLSGDLRAWRLVVQEHVRLWAEDPSAAAGRSAELRDRLVSRLAMLETRVDETFRSSAAGQLRDEDYENLYRFLGSFRGLAEAGLEYARLAEAVNWAQWREERFA